MSRSFVFVSIPYFDVSFIPSFVQGCSTILWDCREPSSRAGKLFFSGECREPSTISLPRYNVLVGNIPPEIQDQRYISLATFRKSGVAVHTPIWFAEDNNKLYLMTNSKSGKCKRIRNNPQVKIAPSTIRGKITGPDFPATARFLAPTEFAHVRQLINAKYWLARLPFLWRNTDAYIEITPT
jgi:PPOX class probable F420-dependent enzyme